MRNFCWLLFLFALCACASVNPRTAKPIAGVSYVAPAKKIDSVAFLPLQRISASWVALMPYAFTDGKTGNLIDTSNWQWWGEKAEGVAACIEMAHQQGLQVMIKPHLWIDNGQFTGNLTYATNAEWQVWESNYANYIKKFARIAQEKNAALFCIGTELNAFVMARPAFWQALISELRLIYKGQITYAENWDKYAQVPFWQELDFIGIDAYFPLSNEKEPSVNQLSANWLPIKKTLNTFYKKTGKPILFTEYGYRSKDHCAREPWLADTDEQVNERAQANAYEALLKNCWQEPWWAGGFLWKWYPNDSRQKNENHDFSPQHKPVEKIIKEYYGSKE